MTAALSSAKLAIMRLKDVKARTGLARSTIYQQIKAGIFPKPISLGPRAVGWLESDIEEWISAAVAKRGLRTQERRASCATVDLQAETADSLTTKK